MWENYSPRLSLVSLLKVEGDFFMAKRINLTGNKYGRLTVLNYDFYKNGRTYWKCLCECGNEKSYWAADLKRGMTKSCGCYKTEIRKKMCTTH